MSENETINPADLPQTSLSKTLGIKNIEGKEVFITGYNHTRGKPNDYTRADQIGDDGLTDYYTITTQESFDLEYKEEGVIPINSWFITPTVGTQIERWVPNHVDAFAEGKKLGPIKAVKRASEQHKGQSYWCLAVQTDKDYN